MGPRTIAAILAAMLLLSVACSNSDSPFDPTSSPGSPTSSGSHPPASSSATPRPSPITYVVQSGDTLAAIAERYGVDLDLLMQVNGIVDPASLQAGQVLFIPSGGRTATPSPGATGVPTSTDAPGGEVSLTTLVDKQHALPSGYVPPALAPVTGDYVAPGYSASLRSDALDALEQMLNAAYAAGYDVRVVSGYRSYEQQVETYNYWVQQLGEEEANRVSAKPGYSEHQLGSTADLGTADAGWDLTEGFGATPAGQWLAANSVQFGFALSYPQGKEDITGYAYEPWHFRYIGVSEAQAWQASGQTLNQFLGA